MLKSLSLLLFHLNSRDVTLPLRRRLATLMLPRGMRYEHTTPNVVSPFGGYWDRRAGCQFEVPPSDEVRSGTFSLSDVAPKAVTLSFLMIDVKCRRRRCSQSVPQLSSRRSLTLRRIRIAGGQPGHRFRNLRQG